MHRWRAQRGRHLRGKRASVLAPSGLRDSEEHAENARGATCGWRDSVAHCGMLRLLPLLALASCTQVACWDADGEVTPGLCACPAGGDVSQDALVAVNDARAAAGLTLLVRDPDLDAAAAAHAAYLQLNPPEETGLSGHAEVAGNPGFTGEDHFDRAVAQGWLGPRLLENVSRSGVPEQAVFSWLRTVYHRVPLLGPEVRSMGYAQVCDGEVRYDVALFAEEGLDASDQPIVWPADGDDFVSGTWSGLESPDPVPDVQTDLGYPISVHLPRNRGTVSDIALTGPDGAVDLRLVIPGDDPASQLDDEYFAVPLEPLAFSATYTATASGTVDGQDASWTWSFTTRTKSETPR